MNIVERVQLIDGKKPIIYIAPHGAMCDDIYTARIAEKVAEMTKGYAVINHGWERHSNINYPKEKANCNNVEHCHKDVIKEEFLDPLLRFKSRILKKWSRVCIIYIHGMSNEIQKKTGIDKLNYIIGWGNGHPHSHTCQKWVKDFLIYNLAVADNSVVGEGKAGGSYAGRAKNNMVQLFRKWYYDEEVDSIQLEIANSIRSTKVYADSTAQILSIVFEELLQQDESWYMPKGHKIIQV